MVFGSLAKVFGPGWSTAAESVKKSCTDEEMVDAADKLPIAKRGALPSAAHSAAGAVETIAADPEITRVDRVASAIGLSARASRRLFAEHVGCTPKWAIRIYRLNEAARVIADTSEPDYAALAARLGYSDQPHFSRDFRGVTGRPPAEFARSAHAGAGRKPDNENGRRG